MTRRADSVEETRRQIAAAAARLHTTIGPANTSIAAIADEAGVTRLTVYRHFDDFDVLFAACRAHWRAENPPPDPRAWADVSGLAPRARRAFAEWYAWYAEHATALFPIYRDMTTMPATASPFPFQSAVPRRSSGPIRTVPMSDTRIGVPSIVEPTATSSMSF